MAGPTVCPAIVGPTAVGKTALIAALAAEHPIEVISLDSRQIYRGLRIGTAQPTAEEQAVCPHHLVDFVDPDEKYDAMRYRRAFEDAWREITARGKQPVLVGGTGMYLQGLSEGFMAVPGTSPDRLAAVRAEMDPLSDEEVRRRLADVDPESHARLHENDRYRIQRALEVHALSGETMSALRARQEPAPSLGLEFPVFVLERGVEQLDARIAARTEVMLAEGWIAETEALLRRHDRAGPGLSSIGYREVCAFLTGELAREDLAPSVVRVTRQYAKRQRTWFRKVDARRRAEPDDAALAQDLDAILRISRHRS